MSNAQNSKIEEVADILRRRLQSANQRLVEVPGPSRAKLESEADLLGDVLTLLEKRRGCKAYSEARQNVERVTSNRRAASLEEKGWFPGR